LAKMAGLPVRVVMSSVEEYTASNPTHPTFVTIKSGVKHSGEITAREVRTVHASGAYGALKPRGYLSTHHMSAEHTGYLIRYSSFYRSIPIQCPVGISEPLGLINIRSLWNAIRTC